jgi:hypothetical protein
MQMILGMLCELKLYLFGFKKIVGYLNQKKLTTNYNKTNIINFSIFNDENNFDHLKIQNCGNEPCGELKC